jgi:aspartate/methionine/tyrosine aminotransferase
MDASGIRRVFDLGAKLANPINLSIGQPDFSVPEEIKSAAIEAIRADRNGYTVTQGIPALHEAIWKELAADVGWAGPSDECAALVTSGTSGGLLLACLALLDPGDEAIIPDPYFVLYPQLGPLTGGRMVTCDTYPDFRLTAARVEPLITERTKLVILCSPSNPCGTVNTAAELRDLVDLCQRCGILLVADEIYDKFIFSDAAEDGRAPSPARFSENVLLVRGFGKSYGCTGWRLGYVAGPRKIVQEMAKLQQYTYVCAPSMAQHAAVAAFGVDLRPIVERYEVRRNLVVETLGAVTEVAKPGGAFYAFVRVPPALGCSASAFVERAIAHEVLIIPGAVFSRRDTHFRLSFAAPEPQLHRGLAILAELMRT